MNNTQKLLAGSENLNRMRSEIKLVVNTILSQAEHPKGKVVDHLFKNPNGAYWHVKTTFGRTRPEFYVYCTAGNRGAYTMDDQPIANFPSGFHPMGADGVHIVHEALPSFVDGMVGEYPDLEQKLKPILEASAA